MPARSAPRTAGPPRRPGGAPQEGVGLAHDETEQVLEHRFVDGVGTELERNRLEPVDVAQRDLDDLPPVVGGEPDRRGDLRRHPEHPVPNDAVVVHLGLVVILEVRRAQPFLDPQRRTGRHLEHDLAVLRQPVEHLDVLEELEPPECAPAVGDEAAVEVRCLDRQDRVEAERVGDVGPDDLEVVQRLVQPAERPPEPAVDVLQRFLDRAPLRPLLRLHGRRLRPQLVEEGRLGGRRFHGQAGRRVKVNRGAVPAPRAAMAGTLLRLFGSGTEI